MTNRYYAVVRFEVADFDADNADHANAILDNLIYTLGNAPDVPAGTWDNADWVLYEHENNDYEGKE